jgi:hypothetical protein
MKKILILTAMILTAGFAFASGARESTPVVKVATMVVDGVMKTLNAKEFVAYLKEDLMSQGLTDNEANNEIFLMIEEMKKADLEKKTSDKAVIMMLFRPVNFVNNLMEIPSWRYIKRAWEDQLPVRY